jgi:hypothetical protein
MGLRPRPEFGRIFQPNSCFAKCAQLFRLVGARLQFHACVDVFGVLAEDHHVHMVGGNDRAGHAFEVRDRADTGIEVQLLANGDIEAAEATAHRRGERSFDRHAVFADGVDGFLRKIAAGDGVATLAREHFHPGDLAAIAIAMRNRLVEDVLRGAPDIGADAVAFDKADDRRVRCFQMAIGAGLNLVARGRADMGELTHEISPFGCAENLPDSGLRQGHQRDL